MGVVAPVMYIPFLESLDKVKDAICGWNQDFVMAENKLGFIHWTPSSPVSPGVTSYQDQVVKELMWKRNKTLNTDWTLVTLYEHLLEKTEESKADFIDLWNPMCEDVLNVSTWGLDGISAWSAPLGALLENTDDFLASWECQKLQQYCKLWTMEGIHLRFLCPETCGCNSPNALVLSRVEDGCPTRCLKHAKYQAALAGASCVEHTPAQLQNDSGWMEYASQLEIVSVDWSDYRKGLALKLQHGMRHAGCRVVEIFNSQVGINLCSMEEDFRIGSFRFMCPVECHCTAMMPGCPGNCPKSL